MPTAIAAPSARARGLAHRSSQFAIIAAIVLTVAAGAEVAAPALAALGELAPGGAGAVSLLRLIGANLLLAAPTILIACVCLDLRRVLSAYAGGHFFTEAAAKGVRRAGEGVLWAMAFKCLISPWLYSIVAEGQRGGPPVLDIDAFDLGLIALGFFILVIGRVLQAAAALKADNDQIV